MEGLANNWQSCNEVKFAREAIVRVLLKELGVAIRAHPNIVMEGEHQDTYNEIYAEEFGMQIANIASLTQVTSLVRFEVPFPYTNDAGLPARRYVQVLLKESGRGLSIAFCTSAEEYAKLVPAPHFGVV